MNHQHSTRNHIPKGPVVKQIGQYAFFLVVCIWLLYQMKHSLSITTDCNIVESKFREEYIGRILGRKVDVGSSDNPKELDLYGMDLIEVAKTITHVDVAGPGDVNKSDDNDTEEKSEDEEQFNKSELKSVTEENKASTYGDEYGKVRRTEGIKVESDDVNIGAVILKSDGTSRVFQFSDENGIPELTSAPSRRSDVQVESLPEENSSSSSNQSREVEECEQIWEQDIAKKQKLNKFRSRAVVKSGILRRREILFAKKWMNKTRY